MQTAVRTDYPPKIFRMMMRELVIVRHPFSVCVPVNYKVTLSVRAEGTGILCYQWFTDNRQEVPGATQAELTCVAQRTQSYVCRVNDRFCNCEFSDWVKVKVMDVDKPGAWQGELHIVVQPKSQTVRRGEKLTLSCAAVGVPLPVYRWYRNGQALDGKSAMSDTLQIDHAAEEHAGSYLCSVSNVGEERWTEAADVDIVLPDRPAPTTPTASDKVALLIGNLNYSHHPGLLAPTMDVHTLANLLQQLGFRVVSLLDLTRKEMQAAIDKFIQLLDKGVYGLFYYAGHGYERSGRNYLVPVDAPQPYQPNNCVCVQRVMLGMQEKRTALNVVLLDTCRKWYNQDCLQQSEIRHLEPSGNTVYGYATCENAEAFEVQDGGQSTGIFTKYLNKHILQSLKITHVLEHVSEDLGRDPLVTGKQVVEIKHTLKESRSLADPVRTVGHTKELCLRDASWRQANELPRKRRLKFPCGVEVEVSFSALFSNVMVAFAIVKTTGPTTQDCSVTLTSTPAMEDIFSGFGRSDEMDSLLYSDNHDCTLTLCGLQKLQGPLVIKVDMHYTHINSKLRLKESQELDIGKPLVASCKLYKAKSTSIKKRQDAHSMGAISKPPARQTRVPSCHPVTRKAECATRVTTARSNEPEENDESELHFTS